MRLKIKLLFVFFFTSLAGFSQVKLTGDWKYIFNDDKVYASSSFNDAEWKTKDGAKLAWSNTDLKDKGSFIWIRKSVVIPSSLKKELEKTGALMLYMGKIRQDEETYLNGKLIGKTGSGDLDRAYILNINDIFWDKENLIAIKIRHWGDLADVEYTPTILAAKLENILILNASAEGVTAKNQVKNKDAVYSVSVKNKSTKTFNTDLFAVFYDLNHKKLASFNKKVNLKPGNNTFKFPYHSPSNFIKIQYNLSIPKYSFKTIRNDEYGYENIVYQPAEPVLAYKAAEKFTSAKLEQQTVLGWLGERLKANKDERLYKVEEEALLAGFINKPGVHPWIGEHVGKFLEAACNTYKNTGDGALKIQIDRTAQQLISAQLADGYLGTYNFGNEWTSWDVWSHKYDLVGLLSYYQLTGFKPALNAAQKIGDLMSNKFGNKPGQLDIIKSGAHVGMAATSILDPMTDLYRFTGNKKYLDFCYYIINSYNQPNGPKIISTLDSTGRVDKTANAKAYEMLSNIVGLTKLYRVTADISFLKPVELAWSDIVKNRLYITGTTSSFEHFQDDQLLPASNDDHMGEGCVTTTWVQLNYQLLCLFGDMKYLNELERSVYNHLTGAENPQTGGVSYYTPLMGVKPYRTVITCCMSSVPRGIAMIPEFANGKINGMPSFLFYQPGVYKTSVNNKEVSFITKTNFPEDGKVNIEVDLSTSSNFKVLLRKPYWAKNFSVNVNGELQNVGETETLTIERKWRKGDVISVNFTMPLMLLGGGKSYPNSVAFQRGPQILVFDKNLNTEVKGDISISTNNLQFQKSENSLPNKWVGTQAYQVDAMVNNKKQTVVLVPYADASQTGGEVTTWMKSDK